METTAPSVPAPSTDAFIARWRKSGGAERANYGLFISELCDLISVTRPDPATEDDQQNAYTFDRLVTHTRPDGSTTSNYIDCYKRGHFIFETKQGIEKRARDAGEFRPAAAPKLKSGHGTRGSARWDAAMLAARNQAERYARALPPSEGWPPFLIIADIGHTIELYSEFSRTGKTYVPFPDPQTFRIPLADLAKPEIRERLRLLFTDPLALDPTRHSAKVTREVAQHLAQLSKSLEADGHEPERTANFLMRCIFTMFAEDVQLIPPDSFRDLLKLFTTHARADQRLVPALFPGMVHDVWRAMDEGGVSSSLRAKLQRFNGGLFADTEVLPLNENQITLLYTAATCQWREVEPAIFGTLLERALNAKERHKLGAHYTPRAYVERLVLPTVIDPLREDWQNSLTAAVMLDGQGKWQESVQTCRDFLYQLTQTIVLDPACGTGNFLYVTLEHMKRLEGEVRDAIANFTGSHQAEIEATEFQVDPHQFLGIEINPRAAAIAELVLWIGYLQWQIKALGTSVLNEPILQNFQNIENRDAVLQYSRKEPRLDSDGNPVTRWDGDTKKLHPVTGELVPDETARVVVYDYLRPHAAEWPFAHFIVGNPPFLGPARMRDALGDGYAEALREAHPDVPESADFVMYWWNRAAYYMRVGWRLQRFVDDGIGLVEIDSKTGKKISRPPPTREQLIRAQPIELRRFGFITTNSLRQTFNRRVLQFHMQGMGSRSDVLLNDTLPVSLAFAIPDHPWVESSDGAAVRIAMTVAQLGQHPGILQTLDNKSRTDIPVCPETQANNTTETTSPQAPSPGDPVLEAPPQGEPPLGAPASRRLQAQVDMSTSAVNLNTQTGTIHPDLTIGAAVADAKVLVANLKLSSEGIKPHGEGFLVTPEQALQLGYKRIPELAMRIRHYRNGRDITKVCRNLMIIDVHGLTSTEVQIRFPEVYQWLFQRVKPERDENNEAYRRDNWWLFGRKNTELRAAINGLLRYVVTVKTAKHRVFTFMDGDHLPDSKLIIFALSDAFHLGTLSSYIHITWALAAGSNLGVGNDPTYVKSASFEKFPFPTPTPEQTDRIRDIAERLDAHRKRQQTLHPKLTLTDCYNVLEKLRAGETLTAKDRTIHEQGLVTVLLQLHNDLDAAVAEAYGWPAVLTDAEILNRLVDLNHQRAAEEARGKIRYLRPEYQNPAPKPKEREATQQNLLPEDAPAPTSKTGKVAKGAKPGKETNAEKQQKEPWPKTLPEQAKAVQAAMQQLGEGTAEQVAGMFNGVKPKQVEGMLQTLVALGQTVFKRNRYFVQSTT